MLPSVLFKVCHEPCGPSDLLIQRKMAPPDAYPEDRGHLLGDGIGGMPPGWVKIPGCQKFQPARTLLPSELSSHILCYAPPENPRSVTRECTAHLSSQLRFSRARAFKCSSLLSTHTCMSWYHWTWTCHRPRRTIRRVSFVLVVFRLRCLSCTVNGKSGQCGEYADLRGSNGEWISLMITGCIV